MANTDRPAGFAPFGPLLRQRAYSVDSSNGTAIFINDVVMAESDGNIAPAAVDSEKKLGSAINYVAVSTATTSAAPAMVSDHPDQEYIAQDDGATTPAQTDIFMCVDHVIGAGSTTTLLSGHELGLGSLNASAGKGFVLLDHIRREDNDAGAVNADWRCVLNTGEGILNDAAGV